MTSPVRWIAAAGLALALAPAAHAALPQFLTIDCPRQLTGVYLETVDPYGYQPPSGWTRDTSPYGYTAATLPGVKAWPYGGWLNCGYGVPLLNAEGELRVGGSWIARIRRAQPSAYVCYAVEEVNYYGFDCYRWP